MVVFKSNIRNLNRDFGNTTRNILWKTEIFFSNLIRFVRRYDAQSQYYSVTFAKHKHNSVLNLNPTDPSLTVVATRQRRSKFEILFVLRMKVRAHYLKCVFLLCARAQFQSRRCWLRAQFERAPIRTARRDFREHRALRVATQRTLCHRGLRSGFVL